MRGVSVIICCYNSSSRLPRALDHIAVQAVPREIPWEVILVDNASADGTAGFAAEYWKNSGCSTAFRIIHQPEPGLSAAKKKGIDEARYEYLLFCDDDNWLDPDYVRIAFETMEEHPAAAIAGGQSTGSFETPEPEWFRNFSQSYVVEQPLPQSGFLPRHREYLAGAGMVARKELFSLLGGLNFNPVLTGRKGNNLMSGEDYELCLLAGFLGFGLFYNDRLRFVHHMPAERLSWKYFLRMRTHGQAIPEIYYYLYRSLFNSSDPSAPDLFKRIYKILLNEYSNSFFFPEGLSLEKLFAYPGNIRYFVRQYPGSVKQKDLLSAKNKLVYLLKEKNSSALIFSACRSWFAISVPLMRLSWQLISKIKTWTLQGFPSSSVPITARDE